MRWTPFVYETYTNSAGQTIDFVEHPIYGDEYFVIAVHHDSKSVHITDFLEVGEMTEPGGEYEVFIKDGELVYGR